MGRLYQYISGSWVLFISVFAFVFVFVFALVFVFQSAIVFVTTHLHLCMGRLLQYISGSSNQKEGVSLIWICGQARI